MMVARPKKYHEGGWLAEHEFLLEPEDKEDLKHYGFSDQDLRWIEQQMTLFNVERAGSKAKPSSAEVRAALEAGEKRIARLRDWIADLDDVARDLIEDVAETNNLPWRPTELETDLERLEMLLAMAWRRADKQARSGRPAGSLKEPLAESVVARFDRDEAQFQTLCVMLQDDGDVVQSYLTAARKKLGKNCPV